MKTLSFVVALIAVAVAGYAVYNGQAQQEKLAELERKASALEAAIDGIVENINARAAEGAVAEFQAVPGQAVEELEGRVAELERKLSSFATTPEGGRGLRELFAQGAREMIRKIVREEQAVVAEEEEEKRSARMMKMQKRFEDMAERHKENQAKRLEEWVKKFSDKEGLTIAQEEGILEAYRWASEERDRVFKEKRREGGPVMFGPEDFREIAKKRDDRIGELLSAVQFDGFEKYRSKNPLPEMGFAVSVGPEGEGEIMDAVIVSPPPLPPTGKEDEQEGEGK